MARFEFLSDSAEETICFGERIGGLLGGGEIVCLVGDLGSGKTHLIKGIAAGLGVEGLGEVNSPTFVIVNEYESGDGRLEIYHIDAYRLGSVAEFEMLGFDDLCYGNSIVLIEWADKVEQALRGCERIEVKLCHVSENQRKIFISAPEDVIGLLNK